MVTLEAKWLAPMQRVLTQKRMKIREYSSIKIAKSSRQNHQAQSAYQKVKKAQWKAKRR